MKLSPTLFVILIIFSLSLGLNAQENTPSKKLYNPNADAITDITNAIAIAKKENKHVLLQIGGNWCSWCIALIKR